MDERQLFNDENTPKEVNSPFSRHRLLSRYSVMYGWLVHRESVNIRRAAWIGRQIIYSDVRPVEPLPEQRPTSCDIKE